MKPKTKPAVWRGWGFVMTDGERVTTIHCDISLETLDGIRPRPDESTGERIVRVEVREVRAKRRRR